MAEVFYLGDAVQTGTPCLIAADTTPRERSANNAAAIELESAKLSPGAGSLFNASSLLNLLMAPCLNLVSQ